MAQFGWATMKRVTKSLCRGLSTSPNATAHACERASGYRNDQSVDTWVASDCTAQSYEAVREFQRFATPVRILPASDAARVASADALSVWARDCAAKRPL